GRHPLSPPLKRRKRPASRRRGGRLPGRPSRNRGERWLVRLCSPWWCASWSISSCDASDGRCAADSALDCCFCRCVCCSVPCILRYGVVRRCEGRSLGGDVPCAATSTRFP